MTGDAPTYVLVHGAFCDSTSWAGLQRELALRGARSLAVDLPGHGFGTAYDGERSSCAGVTQQQAVDHVVGVVRAVAEQGPVVLVAHSRGGLTTTGVANAVPDLLQRLVYVSAWCCTAMEPAGYTQTPEYGENTVAWPPEIVAADPAELGALRMNWHDPAALPTLKAALYANGTDDDMRRFLALMQSDETLDVGTDRGQPDTWGTIARTYVRLTDDRAVSLALQDKFIADADAMTPQNKFTVHSLADSHLGPLVNARALADLLVDETVR